MAEGSRRRRLRGGVRSCPLDLVGIKINSCEALSHQKEKVGFCQPVDLGLGFLTCPDTGVASAGDQKSASLS